MVEQNHDEPQTDGSSRTGSPPEESIRPFRLVKYFSLTGFSTILIFTLILTIFLSHQAKNLVLKKSEDYALLLADNLNHQVFQQFILPTAMHYGRIRLRDPDQYKRLDNVVRNIIHSLQVLRVNIYDLEGHINYSTDRDLVGNEPEEAEAYEKALNGESTTILITKSGPGLTFFDQTWTLRTLSPFRAEIRLMGPVGEVLGVFEIFQDLTSDYAAIARFQLISIAISIISAGVLIIFLRQLLVKGERIIESRNEERRRLAQKLNQAERLAALGQMIAVVAHEIRNPLGIISSTAEILMNKIKNYEPRNRLAEVIVAESRRLDSIVTEFLDFARPKSPNFISCRLEDVIEKNLIYLAAETEKNGIKVIRDYQGPKSVQADPDLLYRAFLNVFINAIQAMPQGGLLEVTTTLSNSSEDSEARTMEIVVADTGVGIDPEKMARLFDPFYTTKNRGTGLGLAIVKNIVNLHNGVVTLTQRQEGGTRLTVKLPVTQG